MSERKTARETVLGAIEDGFADAVKSLFVVAVSQDAGDGGKPKDALAHLEKGMRIVKEIHEDVDAIVNRVFPA